MIEANARKFGVKLDGARELSLRVFGRASIKQNLPKSAMSASKVRLGFNDFFKICFGFLIAAKRNERSRSLVMSLIQRRVRSDCACIKPDSGVEFSALLSVLSLFKRGSGALLCINRTGASRLS